jgi:hypothetical protein
MEILGEPDPATGSFIGRAYDNQGNVTVMRAQVDEQGVWRFTGGGDVAAAARPPSADASGTVRSILTVSPDGSGMTARWSAATTAPAGSPGCT